MLPVYADKCLSRKAVHSWVEKFSQGRSKIVDEVRSGRPVQIATDASVQRVEEMIRGDRRVTIDSVAAAIGCSHGSAYSIMHDRLKFKKVCSRWVPRQLTDEHKMNRLGLSLQHLCRYADEGEDMLNRIITGDESWVHHYQPESKRASMQWKHPSSPCVQKFKVTPSAGKVMLTVFWDCQGVLLTNFQKKGDNVNSESYCEVLLMLRDAIRRKRPGLLTRGVLLLHDNARPHTARLTQEKINHLGWELLEHPPYSPDLAPSDFHLFGPLKTHLGGRHFANDAEVECEVKMWFRKQSTQFYAAGLGGLIKRWDKCINVGGNYVEK
jgi:histone-lysine N-methyltransferase SETMAR